MSYTLRGRLETRLASVLVALVAACALSAGLGAWWPLELAAVMAGVGAALDLGVYHRLLVYQAGWLALPLGAFELGLVMLVAREAGIQAPLWSAVGFFASVWLAAQVLVHAVLPRRRLSFVEDGGELGRAGLLAAVAVVLIFAGAGGAALVLRPPVVHLAAGEHRGSIVLDRRQVLDGEEGTVVLGGVRITADDVAVRDLTVVGGDNGIEVQGAENVRLENVTVVNARMDGIHVRRSRVTIRDCHILSSPGPYTQGIDISYAFDLGPSRVESCTVQGGAEGIVTHFANVMLHRNRVSQTSVRGIAMSEMSMGMIEQNDVIDTVGIGIYCSDYSERSVERNTVVGTRPDPSSDDRLRAGYGIVAHYGAVAELDDNRLTGNEAGDTHAYSDAYVHNNASSSR